MSLIDTLTADIDGYEAALAGDICAHRMRDLVSVDEIAKVKTEHAKTSHRLRYCKVHKCYHLYTGVQFQQWGNRTAKMTSALIRQAYPQLAKAERTRLQEHWARTRARASGQTAIDRARFADWKAMWAEKHRSQAKRVPQSTIVPAPQVTASVKLQDRWAACVDAAAPRLSDTQRAEFYRCARKRAYAFNWQATEALRVLGPVPGREKMSVYNCEFCSGWHMGHDGSETTSREVDLRKAKFALTRYRKPAREFFDAQGIAIEEP